MDHLTILKVLRTLHAEQNKCADQAHKRDMEKDPVGAQEWRNNIQGLNKAIITVNKLAGYKL